MSQFRAEIHNSSERSVMNLSSRHNQSQIVAVLFSFIYIVIILRRRFLRQPNLTQKTENITQKIHCFLCTCKENLQLFQEQLETTDTNKTLGGETQKGNIHNSEIFFEVLSQL